MAFDGQGPLPSVYLRGQADLEYEMTFWRGADWLPFMHGADFDEDGTLEIVASYYESLSDDGLPAGFRILRVPDFTTLHDEPSTAAGQAITGDFDGDGHQDVLALAASSVVHLYRGDGTGRVHFASSVTLPGDSFIRRMLPANLNSDGRTDVAVSQGDGFVSILYGEPEGFSAVQRVSSSLASAGALAAGDFDHDGRSDIAVGSITEPRIAVLVARESGFHHGGFLDTSSGTVYSLTAADLDGDGWEELISTNVSGIVVFYSGGSK